MQNDVAFIVPTSFLVLILHEYMDKLVKDEKVQ